MQRIMLKSKIHRAKVTDTNLYYEGSLSIDEEIMEAADIMSFEKVSVVNVNNGERFETYTIPGKRGSREIKLNGAAARKGAIGDEIIIISYVNLSEEEIVNFKPTLVLVNENNDIKEITHSVQESTFYTNN